MLRMIHTADWHLGAPHQPQAYVDHAVEYLIEAARRSGVSDILVVGDVFDKAIPLPNVKDKLLAQILEAPDLHFHFTVGNHDYVDRQRKYHALQTFAVVDEKIKQVKNMHVYPEGLHTTERFSLWVLPDKWHKHGMVTRTPEKRPLIGAWHGTVPNYDFAKDSAEESIPIIKRAIKERGLDYFALGDIHKQLQLHERCWYSGALTSKTYGCEAGYLELKFGEDTFKAKPRRLPLPERVTVRISDADVTAEKIVAKVKNKAAADSLVRLKFNLTMDAWAGVDQKYLQEELGGMYTEVKLHNDPILQKRSRMLADTLQQAKTLKEELELLVEEEAGTLDKEKLLNLCYSFLKKQNA